MVGRRRVCGARGPDPIKCSTPSRYPGKVPPPVERLGGAGGLPPAEENFAFWPSIDAVFKEFRTILKMKQETLKPGNSDNHHQQDT